MGVRDAETLNVAATSDAAQGRINKRGCHRLAVRKQRRFGHNDPEDRQTITLARPVDVANALPCHIGKDLIEIDPRRGCRCSRKEPIQMLTAIAIESCLTMTRPPVT